MNSLANSEKINHLISLSSNERDQLMLQQACNGKDWNKKKYSKDYLDTWLWAIQNLERKFFKNVVKSSNQDGILLRNWIESDQFPDHFADERGGWRYVAFHPSWLFENHTFDNQDLANYKKHPEKEILSVGSGSALFEQFLVKLGISPGQITLSDLEPEAIPKGMNHLTFDMYQQWPIDKQFDLIIFPESIIAPHDKKEWPTFRKKLRNVIYSTLSHLKDSGSEVRISSLRFQAFKKYIEEIIKQINNDGKFFLQLVNYNGGCRIKALEPNEAIRNSTRKRLGKL